MAKGNPEVMVEPVFDPERPGRSLDQIDALLPMRASWIHGVAFGSMPSRRRGGDGEIVAIRDYAFGDSRRDVDWRATARHPEGTLQVREQYQELEPSVWIVTDVLQPRFHTHAGHFSKQNLGLAAVLASVTMAERKRMPTSVLASNGEKIWRSGHPAQGVDHKRAVARNLARLASAERPQDPDKLLLAEDLKHIARVAHHNFVVVVSDFRDVLHPDDKEGDWQSQTRSLRAAGNEVLAVEVTNAWDFRLPVKADRAAGVWVGGRKSRHKAVRADYSQRALALQAEIDETFRRTQTSHIKLSTADPKWFTSFRTELHKLASRNA